ncbi:MoaD/ThiS family protein [Pseudonocardia phyllosphaerae]|uniref:MoaD/ThiS family protein n=1 Tax=Pseudonocardia phyllosphaerae TaxID=3390502 RepID=UPI00397C7D54
MTATLDTTTPVTGDLGAPTRPLLVRYFAAAKAAAGTPEEKLELPEGVSVDGAVAALAAAHGPQLATVLARCSFLLDEVAVRDRTTPVGEAATLDVLPPFAGG